MKKSEKIIQAKETFGLKESETIREIRRKINSFLKEWHPDTGKHSAEECKEKSIHLIAAKEIIMNYLDNYKISFKEDEIEKYKSPEEFWMSRFGDDHIWSDLEK
ncbi:MAG: hypothetical protein JXJ04_16145 [Spirochaetales bacterium]|nr:hypothetical protein [Spirochaetales bacterium]